MNHRCPHGNSSCNASAKCGPCGGGIVRDGERVRRPMALMDSVQREIADRPAQAAIDATKRAATSLQDAVDEAMRQQAQRDHDLTRNGYHLSLQQFDRLGPIGG